MRPFCSGLGWESWGHMGGWRGLGLLAPLFGVALLVGLMAVLALGAIWLARQAPGPLTAVPQAKDDPLRIAQRRLAAGDITAEEFEEIRSRLSARA